MKRENLKRESRPFVVEVRRGAKANQASGLAPSGRKFVSADQTRTADFAARPHEGLSGPFAETAESAAAELKAPRRILEAVGEEGAAQQVAVDTPRRGRKPGAKNKAKSTAAGDHPVKRGRGRPRRNPEVGARSISLTSEIEHAAIKTMNSLQPTRAKSPPHSPATPQQPLLEPPPKRQRGRPRKVRAPKFNWLEWAADDA